MHMNPKPKPVKRHQFLVHLESVIEGHYSDSNFDVAQLGRVLHLGSMQTYRKVKKHTGLAPGKYLLHYRLEKGTILLRHSNKSISEIAGSCGFEYHHSFSRAFKRHYGISPKTLRERKSVQIGK